MEPQCNVALLHNTPLYIGAAGARTCWDSGDKSDSYQVASSGMTEAKIVCGPNDTALIDRVGNKFKHASILEHISYNWYISNISRALLQELARHRMSSFSVKSTRYTLKELKEEDEFTTNWIDLDANSFYESKTWIRAKKYLISSGIEIVDQASLKALENLRFIIKQGISNDKAKYCLPESYKTELTWSINARSLQNFLYLRSDKAALWEIRELAQAIYNALPDDHKYLFTEKMRIEEAE